jgi:hypothetical protein
MKKILIIVILSLLAQLLQADPIDEKTALKTAENFYQLNSQNNFKSGSLLTLAYKCTSKQTSTNKSASLIAYYYIFNSGSNGFVIVAGDDASYPILGYSTEGSYDAGNVPPAVAKWMDGYKKQLQYIIENHLTGDVTIQSEWNNISNGLPILKSLKSGVLPLIKTKWNQSPFVNDRCPYDYKYNDRTVTGCPATAMAQIMKYWKYPKNGFGFHSYKHPTYGTLSANFSTTTYEWDKMPDVVNTANDAVATLMFHCGVSVEMDYGVAATGGSGSYVIMDGYPKEKTVENALRTYFGYAPSLQGLKRSNYSDSDWKIKLKTELDANRPIQYAGSGTGGHTFVCDGYDSNDYFHMNWGWGGKYDAYFNLNALNPGPGGTGSGAGTYNDGQQAIIGIKPPDTGQSIKMVINKDVTSDKSTIKYGENFTISTDLLNSGQSTFNGDFCAAAFNENGGFVDYIEIKSNVSLGAGYHYTNGFSTDGLLTLLPGTYNVYIFYKPTAGNWTAIKSAVSDLTTKDFTTITVTNKNNLCLYASMVLTPNAPIYKGDSLSVWLDVINYSTAKFTGTIEIDVFSPEGDSITTIEAKSGLSLSTNSHYPGGLTFSTQNLDVPAGSYLLAVFHKWDGSEWELTGSSKLTGSSTSYSNPVMILVQDKPLKPDVYEPNDQPSKSYDLTTSFLGNSLSKNTTGSNLHIGTDIDYYKFTLKSGYDYKVNARLQDKYSNNDGKYYSVDCSFAYSLDGINWSESFDDVMLSAISVSGAKTLYFWVSPYFEGATGTYQLDLSITRSSATMAVLSTTDISSITSTTASSGGNITFSGGSSVTAKGVCWNTSTGPTTANNKTSDGTGLGSFISSITGLTAGTTYYVRAYATNSIGTTYGNEISFASATPVTLTTTALSSITALTASSGGNITSSGSSSITARGVCWNTSTGPTTANNKTSDGTGLGSYISSLAGLTAGTTYYVRAYATNSFGTAYGNEISFTSATPATLTTTDISSITATTASSGGNITSSGSSSITARGVCWSTSTGPTTANNKTSDGTGTGSFTSALINLTAATTYYVRAYATSSAGTAYGNEISFASATSATLTTTDISSITATTASSGGNIFSSGSSSITARGVCWNTSTGPTTANNKTSDGIGTGSFTSAFTNLTAATTYYVRAYATSSAGTVYGNEISFASATPATLTTTDISSTTATTASSGGNITSSGSSSITARGVCWNTSTGPTTASNKSSDGTGTGSFTSALTNLTAATTYYVRAYATSSAGTVYGNEISFVSAMPATLTTTDISSTTATTASSGGNITSSGSSSITARGVCWNTSTGPTTASNKTSDGTGTGSFTSALTNLTAATIYYVRAYATSSAGTTYGNELIFSTVVTAVADYEMNDELINVYPNPASEFTNIDLLNYKHKIKGFIIIDLSGKLVYSDIFNDVTLNRISTADLSSGTYFIKIIDVSGVIITKKLIVEK